MSFGRREWLALEVAGGRPPGIPTDSMGGQTGAEIQPRTVSSSTKRW
ncbi:hypothetical protein BJ970_002615 [Saccharopolyspora phatthalungensis]|uniref:Uncharacterized protein n=1 Tax=Saccharopolyspora phatthalungensis TaxID=664693 RepID=A0A840Q5W0_9PSEU|nr:hypothetical protein [Saccharopolyspora phatthalungensis]